MFSARRAGLSYRDLVRRGRETENFRGSLSENFVLGELLRLGYHPHFWRSSNTAEVDFVIEVDGGVVPIEVKDLPVRWNMYRVAPTSVDLPAAALSCTRWGRVLKMT
ncbi:MAG: DUF4143 domain-containing protein [Corynebacterium sp.]|nr:DUF4143 domain-containing protein [Corynebacterium sp.]